MKMKNSFKYLIFAAIIIFSSSCKDDEDDKVKVSGSVEYKGTSYSLSQGLILDYGEDFDEYNYDFYFSDGKIDPNADNYEDAFSGSVVVYLELYNEGSSFQTGTFTFDGDSKYVSSASINTGSTLESIIDASSGTVTVSGTDDNYTVSFELTFDDETTATGTVKGSLEIVNQD